MRHTTSDLTSANKFFYFCLSRHYVFFIEKYTPTQTNLQFLRGLCIWVPYAERIHIAPQKIFHSALWSGACKRVIPQNCLLCYCDFCVSKFYCGRENYFFMEYFLVNEKNVSPRAFLIRKFNYARMLTKTARAVVFKLRTKHFLHNWSILPAVHTLLELKD